MIKKAKTARLFFALLMIIAPVLFAGCAAAPKNTETAPENQTIHAETLSDIDGHPAEEAIREGLRLGLYPAPSDGLFHPDDPVTLGEYAAAIYNLDHSGDTSDSPVTPDETVRAATEWAISKGYATDLDLNFNSDSDKPITRQDAMRFLYAYHSETPGAETMLFGIYDDSFLDSGQISAEKKPALYWAYYNVLIRNADPDKIDPFGSVSRGDMAQALIRYRNDFLS